MKYEFIILHPDHREQAERYGWEFVQETNGMCVMRRSKPGEGNEDDSTKV
jgi:hypothetical protein